MYDSMIFYRSFYEAIKDLPDQTQLEVLHAVFEYALNDETVQELSPIANAMFTLIKPQIDANNQKKENGKKGAEFGKLGGRPKKDSKKTPKNPLGVIDENPYGVIYRNPSETPKNPLGDKTETPNVNVNANEKVKVKANEKANEKEKENVNAKEKEKGKALQKNGIKKIDTAEVIPPQNQKEKINYQAVVDMYNDTCISFPKVTRLSEDRKKAIKARLNTYSMADLQDVFSKAENSDFLKGRNERNWMPTFDWLMSERNIAKVLDGNYENRKAKESAKGFNPSDWFNY